MTALIDDALVEMVARTLCESAGGAPDAPLCAGGNPLWLRYATDARAALAVAVPVIREKCAEVAADYDPPDGESVDFWNGAAHAADDIDSRIRSLTTTAETGDV